MINITIKNLTPELKTAYELGLSVGLFGASGIAKTATARSLAESLKVPFLVIDAPITDPLLLNGLPCVEGDFARNQPYDMFRPFVDTKGIILIDEISQATPVVASLLSQLIDQKRVGQLQLHPETLVIATGNRREDKAATHLLPAHILNRMDIYSVYLPAEDWISWAYTQNLDTRVIAFLKFRPDMMHDFKADNHASQSAFATPRSWHRLALKMAHSPSLASICATVGESAGVTFKAFLDLSADLPDLDQLLANPASYTRPDNYGLYLALVAAISAKMRDNSDKAQISGFFSLLDQFEPELQVMCIRPCLDNKAILKHKSMTKFLSLIKEYVL